jgi:hypothetical protein
MAGSLPIPAKKMRRTHNKYIFLQLYFEMQSTFNMNEKNTLRKIRFLLGAFCLLLIVSGVTAFPIAWEMSLADGFFKGSGSFMAGWIREVNLAVTEVNARYPYIFYGTDWLAFAHIVIATAFIGPLRDPVRNIWVLQFGMIACLMVFPLALICGPIRHIPFYWRLIDCSFGLFGILPLIAAYRLTRKLRSIKQLTPHTV